jgi:hypothetical protein
MPSQPDLRSIVTLFTGASIAKTTPSIFARTISQNLDCIELLPHLNHVGSLIDAEV